MPIWVADYVLWGYGTGAIMAVPAHDERDFEFAQQFDLPIVAVVDPGDSDVVDRARGAGRQAVLRRATASRSTPATYNGLTTAEFKQPITADLATAGLGREAVNYKLRDWLFSRQRFWGEPFPILHELDDSGPADGLIRAVDAKDLPVDLPHLDDFKPHGTPGAAAGARRRRSGCMPAIDGKRYRRETNTMPQWAGCCWYFLRFIDPQERPARSSIRRRKRPGCRSTCTSAAPSTPCCTCLYSRFWHKVLFDRGHVSTAEPFQKLVNQGMILGEMEFTGYQRADGAWVSSADVRDDDDEQAGRTSRPAKP